MIYKIRRRKYCQPCIVILFIFLACFGFLITKNWNNKLKSSIPTLADSEIPLFQHKVQSKKQNTNRYSEINGLISLMRRRVPIVDFDRIQFQLINVDSNFDQFSWKVLNFSHVTITGSSLSALSFGLGCFYRKFCSTELLSWADNTRPSHSCFTDYNTKTPTFYQSKSKFIIRYGWNAVTFSYSSTYWVRFFFCFLYSD
jgi:hypothetical protein